QQAVLEGTRLHLVGVDHEVARAAVGLGDEAPLQTGIETGAATAAKAGVFHHAHDVARSHGQGLRHALVATGSNILLVVEGRAADLDVLRQWLVHGTHRIKTRLVPGPQARAL